MELHAQAGTLPKSRMLLVKRIGEEGRVPGGEVGFPLAQRGRGALEDRNPTPGSV